MNAQSIILNKNKLAISGVILISPTLLFVTSAILQYELGWIEVNDLIYRFSHPVVILGGPIAAALLNILPLFTVKMNIRELQISGELNLKGKLFNTGVLFLGISLVSILGLYLFVENVLNFH